jgi:hypothetical protein
MKTLSSLLLAGGLALLLVACNSNQPPQTGLHTTEVSQWVGKTVRVELRRDALGTVPLPVGPATGGTNSTPTAIAGKLLKLHSVSLLVEDGQRQIWIPREVILFVELQP